MHDRTYIAWGTSTVRLVLQQSLGGIYRETVLQQSLGDIYRETGTTTKFQQDFGCNKNLATRISVRVHENEKARGAAWSELQKSLSYIYSKALAIATTTEAKLLHVLHEHV